MTDKSETPLLDLAAIISNASLTITKSQLQSVARSTSCKSQDVLDENGADKVIELNSEVKQAPSKQALPGLLATCDVLHARASLLQAASDLSTLILGPADYLKNLAYGYHDITALSVVLEFNIATSVPANSDISFAELSEIVGFDASRLERILRLLFVRKIFIESRPGYVAHSEISKHLAENNELSAFLGHCAGEVFPAASKLTEALRRHPGTEAPNEAAFNYAFSTSDPLFTYLTKNPDRFDRFNLGMAGISQGGGRSAKQVVEGYDWAALGAATVVDVGGGNGHISIELAAVYPSLKLIVQDLPDAIRAGEESLPRSLASRVEFQAHDMFKENPAKGADVFYLRHILHDWPDTHAILILRALVPSLKNGARILVSDSVIPPPGVLDGQDEKFVRYLDMQMLVMHNARERTEEDFVKLFKQADPRLQYQRVWCKGESVAASNILEAIFMDDNGRN